jgi:hypothetical protein
MATGTGALMTELMASIKTSVATSLDRVEGLDDSARLRLAAVSITTAEELLGALQADPQGMGLLLEDEDLTVIAARAGFAAQASAAPSLDSAPTEIFHTGAATPDFADERPVTLEEIDRRAASGPLSSDAPPGLRVDLRSCFGPIRHQGDRMTCVAHGVAALAECLLGRAGLSVDLSEQYIYWNAKQNDGAPEDGGTFVKVAMERQVADGCCLEATWPYVASEIPGNESQAPPPPVDSSELEAHKLSQSDPLTPRDVAGLQAVLDEQRPVALSVPVFTGWKGNAMLKLSGFIPMPLPGDTPDGGHAMCAVGYGYDNEFAGGGYFVLRNSWGTQFAPSSPIEPGHALLPFAYWQDYAWEAFVGLR